MVSTVRSPKPVLKEKFGESCLERCRSGDLNELSRVYAKLLPFVRLYLQKLGASPEESESFAAEVLSDCLVGTLHRPPLINVYQGRCSLTTWMATLARNRYVDHLRLQKKDHLIAARLEDQLAEVWEPPASDLRDEYLFQTLRSSLVEAFQSLSSRDAVLLQLVHGHKVDQRVLARALGWSDTKMCRHLSSLRAMLKVRVQTSLCGLDQNESPRWQDWVEVCGEMIEPL